MVHCIQKQYITFRVENEGVLFDLFSFVMLFLRGQVSPFPAIVTRKGDPKLNRIGLGHFWEGGGMVTDIYHRNQQPNVENYC